MLGSRSLLSARDRGNLWCYRSRLSVASPPAVPGRHVSSLASHRFAAHAAICKRPQPSRSTVCRPQASAPLVVSLILVLPSCWWRCLWFRGNASKPVASQCGFQKRSECSGRLILGHPFFGSQVDDIAGGFLLGAHGSIAPAIVRSSRHRRRATVKRMREAKRPAR